MFRTQGLLFKDFIEKETPYKNVDIDVINIVEKEKENTPHGLKTNLLHIGGNGMKRLKVACTIFANMGDGQIGFASMKKENAMEPRFSYQNGKAPGYIHTRDHVELLALVKQMGAISKDQFMRQHGISPSGSWKNAYIWYLDKEIERVLLDTGIRLTIEDIEVEFYTEPGFYKSTDIKPSKRFMELYVEEA